MANVNDTLRRAEEIFNRGDFNGAELVLAEQWADPSGAPPAVLHLLGAIRLRQRDFPKAEGYFRKAIKSSPKEPKHHAALGDVYSSAQLFDAAADAYGAAVDLNPALALQASYAKACFKAGRLADAEKAARSVLAAEPSAEAWDMLSSILREKGKAEEALSAADNALKLDPGNLKGEHSRAAALSALGRSQEALDAFDSVVARGAESATTAFYRAKALVSLKRYGEALAITDAGLARWPDDKRLQAAAGELRKKV